jgi:hypothetical protein
MIKWQGPFLVGATHCVALVQQGGMREEGEAVPRPYSNAASQRADRMTELVTEWSKPSISGPRR